MPEPKIGNPLTDAAQSGMLGGQRRPLGTKQDTPAVPDTEQYREPTSSKQQRAREVKEEVPEMERVKRTILFTPERAKWLKVRAAMAEKEMSAIVEEALALWEKVNPS